MESGQDCWPVMRNCFIPSVVQLWCAHFWYCTVECEASGVEILFDSDALAYISVSPCQRKVHNCPESQDAIESGSERIIEHSGGARAIPTKSFFCA